MENEQEQPDMIFEPKARYLSLHGSYIDQLGDQPHELVTAEFIQNRVNRDNGGHHVTVVNHLEMIQLMPPPPQQTNKAAKKHTRRALQHISDVVIEKFGPASTWTKPVDLGMGTSEEGQAVSFFRVLHWPFGQSIRGHLGLNRSNFHVTVGFKPRDVHLYKGPATLICLQEGQSCTTRQIRLLVGYSSFYCHDFDFFKKLFRTCLRHGRYGQGARLTKIYLSCKTLRNSKNLFY